MPNREFLENYPLYKKFKINVSGTLNSIPKPAIHMQCHRCKSEQTFNMSNEYYELFGVINTKTAGLIVRAEYICRSCHRFYRIFLIKISDKLDFIMKVGQYPPWEIAMDKNLEKILGKHSGYYKKALVCESQGYGVGAFAYYRRIVEEIIDQLLNEIKDLIQEGEQDSYIEALEKTKKTKVAQDKIKLVKDLLPSNLRPDGMNPLTILHDNLSEGLHAKTDEECLELTANLREILIFLVNQVLRSNEESKKFTSSMRTLLEKKQKKNT